VSAFDRTLAFLVALVHDARPLLETILPVADDFLDALAAFL